MPIRQNENPHARVVNIHVVALHAALFLVIILSSFLLQKRVLKKLLIVDHLKQGEDHALFPR